ncbi:MAG: hypothetical protein IKR92_03905 [Alphaproteobacteria bacterium]|nr:hypothetical protein [Alphaproteobacteria bacterium]
MATQRANHLLNQLNNRIDAKDTEKAKRLAEKARKQQQRLQEERVNNRFERDEQLLLRMADKNKTREERHDPEKLRQRKYTPLQRQMLRGRGRQNERSFA